MKYGLIKPITTPQNLTLQRWSNPQKTQRKVEFLRLEPGFYYDEFIEDDLFRDSLSKVTVKLRKTDELISALEEAGVSYKLKKGCSCSGGKMNVIFNAVEVIE